MSRSARTSTPPSVTKVRETLRRSISGTATVRLVRSRGPSIDTSSDAAASRACADTISVPPGKPPGNPPGKPPGWKPPPGNPRLPLLFCWPAPAAAACTIPATTCSPSVRPADDFSGHAARDADHDLAVGDRAVARPRREPSRARHDGSRRFARCLLRLRAVDGALRRSGRARLRSARRCRAPTGCSGTAGPARTTGVGRSSLRPRMRRRPKARSARRAPSDVTKYTCVVMPDSSAPSPLSMSNSPV